MNFAAKENKVTLGFYSGSDVNSLDSLKANAAQLTHVASEWMTVVDGRGNITFRNRPEHYYPGSEYVDWLGLSIYGMQVDDDPWLTFHEVMDNAYKVVCRLDIKTYGHRGVGYRRVSSDWRQSPMDQRRLFCFKGKIHSSQSSHLVA